MAQTNLFKPLKNTTGDFYMFSQYSDDLTRQNTYQEIYKVVPSRFAAIELKHPNTIDPMQDTLAQYVCRCFQNYYENKVNFMRTNYTEDPNDPWFRYDSSVAVWQALQKFGFITSRTYTPTDPQELPIEIFDEVKYIGDINLYSNSVTDGVNYNEIYCYIPTSARRTVYNITRLTRTFSTPQTYTYGSMTDMMGWNVSNYPLNINIPNVASFDVPNSIYTTTPNTFEYERYGVEWQRPDVLYGLDNQQDVSTNLKYETTDDNFKFNAILLFYDIYNEHTLIERSLPLGIFFLGYNQQTGTWENEMTKWVANDDIYGQGTAYGLRVATRYVTTPNSTYFLSTECEHDDHYSEYSDLMCGIGDAIQRINDMANNQQSFENELRQHYSRFQNYTTNVPYIRYVNNVPTWFVNGRNTGVTAGGSGQFNEYYPGRYIEISPSNVINCTLDDFVGTAGVLNGQQGLVPAPLNFQTNYWLNSDGTWHPLRWRDITDPPEIPEVPTHISQLINDEHYIRMDELPYRVTRFNITVDGTTPSGLENFDIMVPDAGYQAIRELNILTGASVISRTPYINVTTTSTPGEYALDFIPSVVNYNATLSWNDPVTVATVFGTDIKVNLPSISTPNTTYHLETDSDENNTYYYLVDDTEARDPVTITVPNIGSLGVHYELIQNGNTITLHPDDGSADSSVVIIDNDTTYTLVKDTTKISDEGWYDYEDLVDSDSNNCGTCKVPKYVGSENILVQQDSDYPGRFKIVYYNNNPQAQATVTQPGVIHTQSVGNLIIDPDTSTETANAFAISDSAWAFYISRCAQNNVLWQVQLDQRIQNITDPIVLFNATEYASTGTFVVLYDLSSDDIVNGTMTQFTPSTWNQLLPVEHSRFTFLHDINGNDILETSWLMQTNYYEHEVNN